MLGTPYVADDGGTVRREGLHRSHRIGGCNRWSVTRISSLLQTYWVTESASPMTSSAVAHVECVSTLCLSFASCWHSGFRSLASFNASFSVASPLGRWTCATSPGVGGGPPPVPKLRVSDGSPPTGTRLRPRARLTSLAGWVRPQATARGGTAAEPDAGIPPGLHRRTVGRCGQAHRGRHDPQAGPAWTS